MRGGSRRPDWSEVDDLFRRALEVPGPARARYLADETRGAPALRAAVEELLRAADEADTFLEGPLSEVARFDLDGLYEAVRDRASEGAAPGSGRLGARFGPYLLTGRLGRGGMATVYAAERADGQWEQTVALKVIRRGLDTEDVVRRFRAERQILSSLEHPHIARLLDGGSTEDGVPFLVMELVDGEPITAYCDARAMVLSARLRLFCKVGRAVQYAHRNLVVHRDIKPSNILVDRAGEPKLLDFGIAKVLANDPEDSGRTRTGLRLLTPDYASPEQLAGGRVTTSTDVYQLSVLLCVLATGRLPWDRQSSDGPIPARTRDEPIRPSDLLTQEAARLRGLPPRALVRSLRGDLGAIIGKGLRPQREDRYASVEALIDDVENFLAQRPIKARSAAWVYRATKLVRRNPWLPVAAAAALLGVIGYGTTLARHAERLEAERNAAREQAARVEEAQDFLVEVFRSADPYDETGPETTVVDALERGVVRIREELDGRPFLQAGLLGAVADVHTNLGLAATAAGLHAEAAELLNEATEADDVDRIERLGMLGRALLESSQLDSAEVVLERALAMARGVSSEDPLQELHVLHQWGRVAARRGAYSEAERRFLRARQIAGTLRPVPIESEVSTLLELASIYPHLNATAAALSAAEEGLRLSRLVHGERGATTAIALAARADALGWNGQEEEAVTAYGQAIERLTDAFGPGSPEVLNARQNLALRLSAVGDLPSAEAELRRLLELQSARHGARSPEAGGALQNLASNLKQQSRLVEALSVLEDAHAVLEEALEPGHYQTAFPLLTRAEIELARGAFSNAERSSREASAILAASLPDGHYARAVADCRVGRSLVGLGRASEGRAWMEPASAAMARAPGTPPAYRRECLKALAGVLDPDGDREVLRAVSLQLSELGIEGP